MKGVLKEFCKLHNMSYDMIRKMAKDQFDTYKG
jgi:hypothetical protein